MFGIPFIWLMPTFISLNAILYQVRAPRIHNIELSHSKSDFEPTVKITCKILSFMLDLAKKKEHSFTFTTHLQELHQWKGRGWPVLAWKAEQLLWMNLNWPGFDIFSLPRKDYSFPRKSILLRLEWKQISQLHKGFFFKYLDSVISHNATWNILFQTLHSPANCDPSFRPSPWFLRLWGCAEWVIWGLGIYFGYRSIYPVTLLRSSFVFRACCCTWCFRTKLWHLTFLIQWSWR